MGGVTVKSGGKIKMNPGSARYKQAKLSQTSTRLSGLEDIGPKKVEEKVKPIDAIAQALKRKI